MNSAQEKMTRASAEAGQKKADRDARRRELFAWLGTGETPLETAQEEIVRSGTAARAEQTRLRQEKARLEASRTRLEALEKRELPQLVSQLDQAAREEKLAAEERVRLTGELAAAREGSGQAPGRAGTSGTEGGPGGDPALGRGAGKPASGGGICPGPAGNCPHRAHRLSEPASRHWNSSLQAVIRRSCPVAGGAEAAPGADSGAHGPEGGMCSDGCAASAGLPRATRKRSADLAAAEQELGWVGALSDTAWGTVHRQGKGDARDLCADDDL